MDGNAPKTFSKFIKLFTNTPDLNLLYPNKPYFLFTDASKYFCGATLCQQTLVLDNLNDPTPITFIAGKFPRTKCNQLFVKTSRYQTDWPGLGTYSTRIWMYHL